MGLREKIHIERLQKEVLPNHNENLQNQIGASIALEPDWSSFEKNESACLSLDSFLSTIINGIEPIARAEVGREALKEGLSKIVIRNLDTPGEKRIALADKVLLIETAMGGDNYGLVQSAEIQNFLLDNL